MTAYARRDDPATSHEAAATVDTNRSQAAVLRIIDHLPVYFTQKMVVRAYQLMQKLQEAGKVPDRFPQLTDSRVRSAVRELQRLGLLVEVGYTDPPRGTRRELVWTIPEAPTTATTTTTEESQP